MRPMLATRGHHVPQGAEWTHEVKWDGMRILAELPQLGTLRLTSRNENVVTDAFPELAELPSPLRRRDLLLDGEVVALVDGRPDFGALASRIHVRGRRSTALSAATPVTFLVFDLLRLDGRDLTGEPLSVRRELLDGIGINDVHWQVPGTWDDGDALWHATEQQQLEGIVSKRLDSTYQAGARSPHWLKFPHRRRSSWVIGGWRPETGAAQRMGAVLVGEPTPDGVLYRGRVGSGLTGKAAVALKQALAEHPRSSSPFADEVPRIDADGTHWVEPTIVIDVEALGISDGGRLRQPSFRGVRADLTPEDLLDAEDEA
ncbi:non-homologous end-joining DNA ligase [Nocardioides sp. Bht2]|uniref:non-homologous end-joining DNA ligase n=1 Tax=Nocardioides sp. Bht2 TaxID=3392297 RepID=UPI0039B548A3